MHPLLCRCFGNTVTRSVAQGNDVDTQLHVESILYRQTLPISKWIPLLKKMNTRYIKAGSRLQAHRWDDIEEDRLDHFWKLQLGLLENVQLYLVKWRNLSFLHATLESEEELMKLEGPRMKQKIMVASPLSIHI